MKVFIVAAGTLGSTTAFVLAQRNICSEIVIYDVFAPLAAHHAMDIGQSVCALSRTKIRAGTYSDLAGSDIVIVAAGLSAKQFTGDFVADAAQLVPMLQELGTAVNTYAPDAKVIIMTNPVDVVCAVFQKISQLPAKHIIGFSYNDTIRMKWALGAHYGISPAQIDAVVMGEHGPTKVQIFSQVKLANTDANMTEADIASVKKLIGEFWKEFSETGINRTAGWTSATSVCEMVDRIAGVKSTSIPCSCALDGGYGHDGIYAGVPAYLGRDGIERIEQISLNAKEAEAFALSCQEIQANTQRVLGIAGLS